MNEFLSAVVMLAADGPQPAPSVPGDPGFLALLEQHGGWGLSVILMLAVAWLVRWIARLMKEKDELAASLVAELKAAEAQCEAEREKLLEKHHVEKTKIIDDCRDERKAISASHGQLHERNRERLNELTDRAVASVQRSTTSGEALEREVRELRTKLDELHGFVFSQTRRRRPEIESG